MCQGCLNPIRVVIPVGSILDPSAGAAVVGGNVLTSQRIVDVVLKAFQVRNFASYPLRGVRWSRGQCASA
jgi:N-methylhydantoinase B/oxoprolinase/acetone carboxylase alpha subunit